MRVLFLGDVMGRPGRQAVREALPGLKKEFGLDLVIANAENASGGLGVMPKSARDLIQSGVDIMTSGNHVWKHKEIEEYLDREPRLLRPANFPPGLPGSGLGIYSTDNDTPVAVINLLGRTYMDLADCPFQAAAKLLESVPPEVRVRIVDFHAEATSEKKAMAFYLDGKVSAVLGTHTHVQTNDPQIFPKGTAYLTDLGMCGVEMSILGMDHKNIIERFITRLPRRFELARGDIGLRGAIMDIDEETGLARGIETLSRPVCVPNDRMNLVD